MIDFIIWKILLPLTVIILFVLFLANTTISTFQDAQDRANNLKNSVLERVENGKIALDGANSRLKEFSALVDKVVKDWGERVK